jgi:arsenate reductase
MEMASTCGEGYGNPMPEINRVLFVCIENSCRSQMAEAFARLYAQDTIQAFSAGSRPSGQINAKAIAAMAELGYDLNSHSSKSLSEIPQVKYPKMLPLEEFRQVRDRIGECVKELAARIEVINHAKR